LLSGLLLLLLLGALLVCWLFSSIIFQLGVLLSKRILFEDLALLQSCKSNRADEGT